MLMHGAKLLVLICFLIDGVRSIQLGRLMVNAKEDHIEESMSDTAGKAYPLRQTLHCHDVARADAIIRLLLYMLSSDTDLLGLSPSEFQNVFSQIGARYGESQGSIHVFDG
jgi:hypothetical protein